MSSESDRCYIRHTTLPIDEDLTNEFKAHRDLSDVDYSDMKYTPARGGGYCTKIVRKRASISKSICAMLNTGLKSKLFLGVTDEGVVEGFIMTMYQRDHFILSLQDLLSRFHPPCPTNAIETRFVPVLDPDEDYQVQLEVCSPSPSRWLGHTIRDSRYCWCDTEALALCANGLIPRFYVIELSLTGWNPKISKTCPIFANEYKRVYIRRNGYVEAVTNASDIESLKQTDFRDRDNSEKYVNLFEVSDEDFYSYDEDENNN